MTAPAPALQARDIAKAFGPAVVLDGIDFALDDRSVHALLGENGAGKSTLMNILTGLYAADRGTLTLRGRPSGIASPADAIAKGIGMVHQHFRLALPLTGRENVRLAAGALPGLRSRRAVDARLADVVRSSGLEAPLDVPVARLAIAERQRVEILKALVLDARVLILDEPTAVLTDAESDVLLARMRQLADAGCAIVLITHRLREVMAVADRVTVMRDGRVTLAGARVADTTAAALSQAMIGREIEPLAPPSRAAGAGVRLALESVRMRYDTLASRQPLDLQVHTGEIVGIAGIGGNGQAELAESLCGSRSLAGGRVLVDGHDASAASIAARRAAGLRSIPSDRSRRALVPDASLIDNLSAAAVLDGTLGRLWLSPGRLRRHAERLIADYDIRGVTAGGSRPVRLLSGGNAQKAVLARELDDGATIVIAHSPTRGLDVAAGRFVHAQLRRLADRGGAVLLISEDLEEILALSDRVRVMSRGALVASPDERPGRRAIGEMMLDHA